MNLLKILPLLVVLALAACGPINTSLPESTPTAEPTLAPVQPTTSPLRRFYVPTYYSNFYIDVINASQAENQLLIYSPITDEQWAPIIEAFNDHYPWIRVTTVQIGDAQIFGAYQSARAAGQQSADLIISSDMAGWMRQVELGEVLTYASPEAAFLPEWSRPAVGIYTLSSEPLAIIHNKVNYSSQLDNLNQLAELNSANPTFIRNRIVTLNPSLNNTGFLANWFYLRANGNPGWQLMNSIGSSQPIFYQDERTIVEEVGRGSAFFAYFVPTSAVYPLLARYPLIEISFIPEGQPILARHMAITQGGSHPSAAKLMLDFLLSQEGQILVSFGGLTPYRSDIRQVTNYHLDTVTDAIGGPGNLIFISLDQNLLDTSARAEFLARLNAELGQ